MCAEWLASICSSLNTVRVKLGATGLGPKNDWPLLRRNYRPCPIKPLTFLRTNGEYYLGLRYYRQDKSASWFSELEFADARRLRNGPGFSQAGGSCPRHHPRVRR